MRWITCSVAALVLVLAGCGDDDTDVGTADPPGLAGDAGDDGGGDDGTDDPAGGESDGDGTDGTDGEAGAVGFEALEERCDELLDLAVELRGADPEEVRSASTPPGPQELFVGDEAGYLGVGCLYLYDGDTTRDQHRVMLTVSRPVPERAEDPDVRAALWDDLAATEEIDGLGDGAKFHTTAGLDVRSVLHVLVGDDVVAVRVVTPLELEGEAFFEVPALEAAARAFLDRLDL